MRFCRWWKRSFSISLRYFTILITMLSKRLAILMPIFVPTSMAQKDRPLASFYRWCRLSIRETNGTSTAWWIHHGAEQSRDLQRQIPGRHKCIPAVMWPKPGSCASGPHNANAHIGLLTSSWPTCSHFWHLHCASLHIQLWPGNGEGELLPAPWGTYWHPSGEAWRRTEMHWGSFPHPSQHLNFPLTLKLHHTWHLHRTYLLFKGFKQTLQAPVELPTDV